MNYAEIKTCDIANGPGVRISLFVSGCSHHCKGCFNEIAWDYSYGKTFTEETIACIISELRPDYVRGLTLLGGEPLDPRNQTGVLKLLKRVKTECPDKDIWCYTGYDYEKELCKTMMETCSELGSILECLDVLVDGRFVEARKDISLQFRGSSNQRLIDMKRTRQQGNIVIWSE